MVNEVQELGNLLLLPNLDDETIKLINERMRLLIGEVKPLTPAQKQDVDTVMNEWINGKKEGEQ